MSTLIKSGFSSIKNVIFSTSIRSIATSKTLNLKEIRESTDGSTLIVEGVTVPSPRTQLLVRAEKLSPQPVSLLKTENEKPPCYMCSLGLNIKHTDVLILSQFVRSDGCMLPRRITGLCKRQQKKIGKMVTMAQKADLLRFNWGAQFINVSGLMINLTPQNCKKDPKQRYTYKKFNTYFDESTIFLKKIPKPTDRFKR